MSPMSMEEDNWKLCDMPLPLADFILYPLLVINHNYDGFKWVLKVLLVHYWTTEWSLRPRICWCCETPKLATRVRSENSLVEWPPLTSHFEKTEVDKSEVASLTNTAVRSYTQAFSFHLQCLPMTTQTGSTCLSTQQNTRCSCRKGCRANKIPSFRCKGNNLQTD